MKKIIIISLTILMLSCDSEEVVLDGMTLISGNNSKTWEVVSVTTNEDDQVEKCITDDVWTFTQEGWKYPNWLLEISPGFLKCDLAESATMWNWKFNSDFTRLYITSLHEGQYNDIISFDVMELNEEILILVRTEENTWGTDFTDYTITLNAR